MKILVIGGTVFVGRHIVESAIENGHNVTLFNRGKTNADLFPEANKIVGDRESDLSVLREQDWDAVIDVCGYLPRIVRRSAEALKDVCRQYIFVSTGSVYKDKSKPGITEESELEVPQNMEAERMTDEAYGELKAGCEQVVQNIYSDRALIVRPGLVIGPEDPTDRFTYWPVRVAAGGKVLAPGKPERQIQFIDARDLADWVCLLIKHRTNGIFNAIGPGYVLTMSRLLDACKVCSQSDAEFVWVADDFLEQRKVDAWVDLPLWIPANSELSGFLSRDNSKAIAAGLKFRSIETTISDTLQWWNSTHKHPKELRTGLSMEREAELLLQLTP
ncbi:MAG TPA: SDR family oxidoreductase [Oculatellaceae cyanobacterium]